MISITHEGLLQISPLECAPNDALEEFVLYGIGGQSTVVYVSPTAIKLTRNTIFDTQEVTWFKGSVADMSLLVEAAELYFDIVYSRKLPNSDPLVDAEIRIECEPLGFEFMTRDHRAAQALAAKILLNLSTNDPSIAEHISHHNVSQIDLMRVVVRVREAAAERGEKFCDDTLLAELAVNAMSA